MAAARPQTGRYAHTLAHSEWVSKRGKGRGSVVMATTDKLKTFVVVGAAALLVVVVSAGEWWVGAWNWASQAKPEFWERERARFEPESYTESNHWDLLIFHSSLWQIFVMAVTTMDDTSPTSPLPDWTEIFQECTQCDLSPRRGFYRQSYKMCICNKSIDIQIILM